MRTPPDEVQKALYAAAIGSGVPISLLAGLAYALSSYDPRATGKTPKPDPSLADGTGLFLLSKRACDVLGVTDPTDPMQNARAAATLLARLGRDYNWDPQAMCVAFIFGRVQTAAFVKAGKPYPLEVRALTETALNAQRWYQERAQPDGASERRWPRADTQAAILDNAIEGLAAANVSFAPAQALAQRWRKWRDAPHPNGSEVTDANAVVMFWTLYNAAYARAPITDSRTPLPITIEPSRGGQLAESAAHGLQQALGEPFDRGWKAVAVVLLLWGLASGVRRSS